MWWFLPREFNRVATENPTLLQKFGRHLGFWWFTADMSMSSNRSQFFPARVPLPPSHPCHTHLFAIKGSHICRIFDSCDSFKRAAKVSKRNGQHKVKLLFNFFPKRHVYTIFDKLWASCHVWKNFENYVLRRVLIGQMQDLHIKTDQSEHLKGRYSSRNERPSSSTFCTSEWSCRKFSRIKDF